MKYFIFSLFVAYTFFVQAQECCFVRVECVQNESNYSYVNEELTVTQFSGLKVFEINKDGSFKRYTAWIPAPFTSSYKGGKVTLKTLTAERKVLSYNTSVSFSLNKTIYNNYDSLKDKLSSCCTSCGSGDALTGIGKQIQDSIYANFCTPYDTMQNGSVTYVKNKCVTQDTVFQYDDSLKVNYLSEPSDYQNWKNHYHSSTYNYQKPQYSFQSTDTYGYGIYGAAYTIKSRIGGNNIGYTGVADIFQASNGTPNNPIQFNTFAAGDNKSLIHEFAWDTYSKNQNNFHRVLTQRVWVSDTFPNGRRRASLEWVNNVENSRWGGSVVLGMRHNGLFYLPTYGKLDGIHDAADTLQTLAGFVKGGKVVDVALDAPVRSLTDTMTEGSVTFIGKNGTISEDNKHFYYNEENKALIIGDTIPYNSWSKGVMDGVSGLHLVSKNEVNGFTITHLDSLNENSMQTLAVQGGVKNNGLILSTVTRKNDTSKEFKGVALGNWTLSDSLSYISDRTMSNAAMIGFSSIIGMPNSTGQFIHPPIPFTSLKDRGRGIADVPFYVWKTHDRQAMKLWYDELKLNSHVDLTLMKLRKGSVPFVESGGTIRDDNSKFCYNSINSTLLIGSNQPYNSWIRDTTSRDYSVGGLNLTSVPKRNSLLVSHVDTLNLQNMQTFGVTGGYDEIGLNLNAVTRKHNALTNFSGLKINSFVGVDSLSYISDRSMSKNALLTFHTKVFDTDVNNAFVYPFSILENLDDKGRSVSDVALLSVESNNGVPLKLWTNELKLNSGVDLTLMKLGKIDGVNDLALDSISTIAAFDANGKVHDLDKNELASKAEYDALLARISVLENARDYIQAGVSSTAVIDAEQTGTSSLLTASVTVDNIYTVTFPTHPKGINYRVDVTATEYTTSNALTVKVINKTPTSITYGFYSGDNGQNPDNAFRNKHDIIITGF